MRGAQPATSAGARLFCRKPDSGTLHHPAKSSEEINLDLAVLKTRSLRARSEEPAICVENPSQRERAFQHIHPGIRWDF